jgi:uncharacterized membrane protein YcaP (DUF421 family)
MIVVSSVTVYLFIIVALRLFGKKELAQLSVVDLVFILLISNSVQNAMVGANTTLAGGLVAAASLFLVNYLFKFVLYRSPLASRIVQGQPSMLIYGGRMNVKNMAKNRITKAELEETVREHGVRSVRDVNLAVLEVDGNISVLSNDFRKRSVRKLGLKKSLQGK